MKRVVVVAEKLSLFNTYRPTLTPLLPRLAGGAIRTDVPVVCVHPYSHLRYRYPRGLKWQDYPFIGAMKWHLDPDAIAPMKMSRPIPCDNVVFHCFAPLVPALAEADMVVYLTDWSGSAQFFARALLDRYAPRAYARIPRVTGMSVSAIEASLHDILDSSVAGEVNIGIRKLVAAGTLKHRFDYNFNVNSLALLGRTFASSLGRAPAVPLSKYAIQFLYRIRDLDRPLSEGELVHDMQQWHTVAPCGGRGLPDSGFVDGLGSCASRAEILAQCEANGLLMPTMSGHERPRKLLALSSDGRKFLDRLHPDCRDFDLPYRLLRWSTAVGDGDENAAHRADRYIRTFFGKQMRFLNRTATSTRR